MSLLPNRTKIIQAANAKKYLDMFRETMLQPSIEIRGQEVKELIGHQIVINPVYPFMDFTHRNLNIPYFAKEMIWKLGADPYDESIKQCAKMWESVQNSDGTFNSNYGQYWFGQQNGLWNAFLELAKDLNTRRSVIPMLKAEHIGRNVKDTVCTGHITFLVRNNKLMTLVSMRSSDQIFGLGTDIPTFAFLQRMMLALLQLHIADHIGLGEMTITADSSHIYKRHFPLVRSILHSPMLNNPVEMPMISEDEVAHLMSCGKDVERVGQMCDFLLNQSEIFDASK